MRARGKAVITFVILLGFAVGYWQYASVMGIDVSVLQSVGTGDGEATYDIDLMVNNPSLLTLTAGETNFVVMSGQNVVGTGTLEPFMLNPMDSSTASGTFHVVSNDAEGDRVWITGIASYNLMVASLDVPFTFYPTDDQVRKFIDHS